MKSKLKLDRLKIESFITDSESSRVRGGSVNSLGCPRASTHCITATCFPPNSEGCHPNPSSDDPALSQANCVM